MLSDLHLALVRPPAIEQSLVLRSILALALCATLVLFPRPARPASGPLRRAFVLFLTVLSAWSYIHFGAFHGVKDGEPELFHIHDIFHYYLGSKYFAELGYDNLYPAAFTALSEIHPEVEDFLEGKYYRRMSDYRILRAVTLRSELDRIRSLFSKERWSEFKGDLAAFEAHFARYLSPEAFHNMLADHGYNPPPTFALIAGQLSRRAPLTEGSLYLLAGCDLLLLIAAWLALTVAFGFQTAVLTAALFFLNYLSDYSWIGGSFLRMLWLSSLTVSVALLQLRRSRSAGVALGLAIALRGFPAVALAALALRFGEQWYQTARRQTASVPWWRAWKHDPACLACLNAISYAIVTSLVLLVAAGPLTGRPAALAEWLQKSRLHGSVIGVNNVGLSTLLAFRPDETITPLAAGYARNVYVPKKFGYLDSTIPDISQYIEAAKQRTLAARRPAQIAISLLAALLLLMSIPAVRVPGTIVAGLMLLPLVPVQITCYYYSFLFLLPLLFDAGERALSPSMVRAAVVVLMAEAVQHLIPLGVHDTDAVFAYQSLLIIVLFAGISFRLVLKFRNEPCAR